MKKFYVKPDVEYVSFVSIEHIAMGPEAEEGTSEVEDW